MNGRTVEVRFPRELSTDGVLGAVRGLSGLRPGQRVVFDTLADEDGIRHAVTATPATLAALRGILRAEIPALRLLDGAAVEPSGFETVVRWRLTPRPGVLREDQARLGSALLSAIQPLAEGERLLIRLVVGRGRAAFPPERSGTPRRAAQDRALRGKAAEPMLRVRLLMAAEAAHPKRREHLLGRVSVVLRSLATPHGRLAGWRVPSFLTGRQLSRDGLGLLPDALSAAELSGLLAWPAETPILPGLSLGSAPLRMPPRAIPRTGRRIARANWPGAERDLCIPVPKGALGHAVAAGPSGVGKSALMLNGILDTIRHGAGGLVVDGRGDLAADVLARVGERDVLVLDPGSDEALPGLRIHGGRDDAELLADVIHGVLASLFADAWGVYSEKYLRLALVALAQDSQATLADLAYVLAPGDSAFRRGLVSRIKDPLLRADWQSFEAMGEAERAHVVAAPLRKAMSLIGRPRLRAILGQSDPKLDLAAAMRRGQLIVVNLAPGAVGDRASQLLGALVAHALYVATRARARVAPAKRRPFFAFFDEPQALAHLPVPLDRLLEQSRGLGVGLTIAVQSAAMLPKSVSRAMFTNAASVVSFRQNADDAKLLAREFDGITPDDLQQLGQFEVVARIGLGDGAVAPPVTGVTFPPPPTTNDPATVRAASAARHGMEPSEVDAALFARHKQAADDVPIGRTRRSS